MGPSILTCDGWKWFIPSRWFSAAEIGYPTRVVLQIRFPI